MATTTNTTPEQTLRAALKSAGFNARKVTVHRDHSTLRVTIRDAAVPRSIVKAIADQFSVVRRDEGSGEILCGGNTFVDVQYLPALVEPAAAAVVALLRPAADGVIVALPGGFRAAKISPERGAAFPGQVQIWGPGFNMFNSKACGVEFAAERIAIAYLDACASTPAPATESASHSEVRGVTTTTARIKRTPAHHDLELVNLVHRALATVQGAGRFGDRKVFVSGSLAVDPSPAMGVTMARSWLCSPGRI